MPAHKLLFSNVFSARPQPSLRAGDCPSLATTPILPRMRSLLAFVVVIVVALPSAVMAQESGAELATPRSSREVPSAGTASDVQPPPTPLTSPAESLGSVPPPPPSAYDPGVRYPTPAAPGPVDGLRLEHREGGLTIPSRLATRLRVLDSSLGALAARGGGSVVDGILSIAGGATITGIGIWQLENSRSLASYLILWGSANVVRGVVGLALSPNPSRAHVAFTHRPMSTLDEARARLEFGERELEILARRSKAIRVLDASLNMAAGIAFIPVYLAPNDFKIVDPFDYFILIGSGISVLSGLLSLFTRSDAERRWAAYQDLRDRMVRESGEAVLRPTSRFQLRGAGIAPVRAGAALTLDATF